jgi:hypothetical protein
MRTGSTNLACLVFGIALVGCVAPADAPAVDDDRLGEAQLLSNGGWTANALGSFNALGRFKADATFTGPANASRRFGVCGLKVHLPSVACNTTADCNNAPTSLPAGGFRYCSASNGVGQKYCMFRPGPAANFCAGTPVTGTPVNVGPTGSTVLSKVAMAPGDVGALWQSYACFEGCLASDPSSSSLYQYTPDEDCEWQGNEWICW